MSMQDGVPFAAVAGDTDIKQSGNGTVDGIDRQRVKDITACTHNMQKSPLRNRCTVCINIAFLTK